MKKKKKEEEGKKNIVKTKGLTTAEQQRIQIMKDRGGELNLWGKRNDLLEVEKLESGESVFRPFLKKDLNSHDGPKEMASRMMEATGCTDFITGMALLVRMAKPLYSKDSSVEEIVKRTNEFARMMTEFQPNDAIEGALCSQIIVCQEKAMQLLAKANVQDSPEWYKLHSNSASKLLTRSQAALQQLISYRKNGQTITVQHLHAESGSQIAVGHFESNQGDRGRNQKNCRGTS